MTTTNLMPDWTLTAADRCDACGSRAYVRVVVNVAKSELLWCIHHAREYEPVLRPVCVDWVDESDALNPKLDVSP